LKERTPQCNSTPLVAEWPGKERPAVLKSGRRAEGSSSARHGSPPGKYKALHKARPGSSIEMTERSVEASWLVYKKMERRWQKMKKKTKRLERVGDLGRTRKGSERMNVRESVLEEDW
jgi:hypothetical protein